MKVDEHSVGMNAEPYARQKIKARIPGGRRDDTLPVTPAFVRKIAEGKASHELGWKVKVMLKKKKCTLS